MNLLAIVLMVTGLATDMQNVAAHIATDAAAIDRVAEVAKRDLPVPLLKRMVEEDIDLMRGRRPDGTYEYATWERFEAGRTTESFSVKSGGDAMQTVEVKGAFVYRAILEVPERRLLVRKNVPIWIERVDVEYVAESAGTQRTSIDVKIWLQPGEFRPVDLPAVARQATVRVVATADPKGSYGNLEVALIEARIIDNSDSPFATSVSGAKAALKALADNDIGALRQAAGRMLEGAGEGPTAGPAGDPASGIELQGELQAIEDLLTGSESERRDGMDRLHQLIRRLREK